MLGSVDHTTLCRHIVENVLVEQFVSVMEGLQHSSLETMAAAVNDRGLCNATGRPLSERVAMMHDMLLRQGQSG